ncbi:endonuclease/exonuclease/phosphatase family protein [Shewanella sp. NIFS-20-20]|uniref:endonuclease/exonuclease/phosphatase family protein n=1 Tax=Shewanella sp. NIFS-20-20 TaxID=2853806 RepID=UPI001C46F27A|nr:endonuclease/exonuclease/phosphatase family protein [Shewanella sp. NIFS-20-20]MBV7315216.1 endonuclease/exonuclease/phosphatase family protein [Shewanella sp. NIFS-20-20]
MKKGWLRLGAFASVVLLAAVVAFNLTFEPFDQPAVAAIHGDFAQFNDACVVNNMLMPLDDQGRLNIGVWNIYKQQKPQWDQQLNKLVAQNELVLLQEASLTPRLKQVLAKMQRDVVMARAFSGFNVINGVMNVSRAPAIESCAWLAKEPWIRLPKSALVSHYPLSNGEVLLVINIHSINFEWRTKRFQSQLMALTDVINEHQGPLIIAGDFNTWRQARQTMVLKFIEKFHLREAIPVDDHRTRVFGHTLDHMYYRGLVLRAVSVENIASSDHNPIMASFELQPVRGSTAPHH